MKNKFPKGKPSQSSAKKSTGKPSGAPHKKDYKKDTGSGFERKPSARKSTTAKGEGPSSESSGNSYKKGRSFSNNKTRRTEGGKSDKPFGRKFSDDKPSYKGKASGAPYKKDYKKDAGSTFERKPSTRRSSEESGEGTSAANARNSYKKSRSFSNNKTRRTEGGKSDKPFGSKFSDDKSSSYKGKPSGAPYKKDYKKDAGSSFDRKPSIRKSSTENNEDASSTRSTYKKPFSDKPGRAGGGRSDKPFKNKFSEDKPSYRGKSTGDKPAYDKPSYKRKSSDDKPAYDKPAYKGRGDKPAFDKPAYKGKSSGDKPYKKEFSKDESYSKEEDKDVKFQKYSDENKSINKKLAVKGKAILRKEKGKLRLNRYIANAGVCSRRDADLMISDGMISVNGNVVTEMGYMVDENDTVKYGNKILNRQNFVYVLLNKPKGFITTTEDPNERKTVMDLVHNACTERIYPVGRLDRNTTGLLLFTNDGELAERLTHPSNGVKKIYQADLDKPLSDEDFYKIQEGLELEDGPVKVDEIGIVNPERTSIGLEIHLGRNRIVRRIFEHLGYEVVKLDRVVYAGLTKKDLPRGNWRKLSEKEVVKLKYFV